MQATLSAPLTLNPQQAAVLVLRSTTIDHPGKQVIVRFALIGAGGAVLDTREVVISDAATVTWLTAQESTILNALLTKMGVTGTVA